MADLQWGPACENCGDAWLVHRGAKHDGPCGAVRCAIDLERGWSRRSRCEAFKGALPSDDDPPIPDAPSDAPPVMRTSEVAIASDETPRSNLHELDRERSDKPRRLMSDAYWREPYKWDRLAGNLGVRRRVFCASMADVFDDEAPPYQLARLFKVITETPNLDWLLLTKRPERMRAFFTQAWPNIWLGTSVEDQEQADIRIPELLATPATVRFLSCEPLLGPVEIAAYLWISRVDRAVAHAIDWVIIGGESGPRARPMDLAWARSLVDQCRTTGVKPFVKQLGAFPVDPPGVKWPLELRDRKGGEMEEWPEDLRIREFPR